ARGHGRLSAGDAILCIGKRVWTSGSCTKVQHARAYPPLEGEGRRRALASRRGGVNRAKREHRQQPALRTVHPTPPPPAATLPLQGEGGSVPLASCAISPPRPLRAA